MISAGRTALDKFLLIVARLQSISYAQDLAFHPLCISSSYACKFTNFKWEDCVFTIAWVSMQLTILLECFISFLFY